MGALILRYRTVEGGDRILDVVYAEVEGVSMADAHGDKFVFVDYNQLVCPKCGRLVKVRQEWRFNRTWFYIHCKCGKHKKSEQRFRGESLDGLKEKLIEDWKNERP